MTEMTDSELLQRFKTHNDEDAFAILLERHKIMVINAARSVLGQYGNAEDILQATFLTLAQKAGSLSGEKSLAGWLYHVTVCLARNERKREQRRRHHEQEAVMTRAMEGNLQELPPEQKAILYEEIDSLSAHDRAAVVLHHLEEKTYEDAAHELGCNAKTFSMRLSRARKKLHKHLTRRGVVLSAAVLLAMLNKGASAAEVSPAIITSTCKGAGLIAKGSAVTSKIISVKVSAMTKGVMKMLFWAKVKMVAVASAAVVIVSAAVPLTISMAGTEGKTAKDKYGLVSTDSLTAENTGKDHIAADNKEDKNWKKEILEKLKAPLSVNFEDAPLKDVVTYLSQMTKVNIVIAARVDPDKPITLKLTNMSAKNALGWIAKLSGLEYKLSNGAVVFDIAPKTPQE